MARGVGEQRRGAPGAPAAASRERAPLSRETKEMPRITPLISGDGIGDVPPPPTPRGLVATSEWKREIVSGDDGMATGISEALRLGVSSASSTSSGGSRSRSPIAARALASSTLRRRTPGLSGDVSVGAFSTATCAACVGLSRKLRPSCEKGAPR